MKIISEISIRQFESWSGATSTQERIIKEGKDEQFDDMIDELYPDGLTDTQLNDLLWFDSEFVFKSLGIEDEENEDSDDE